MRPFLLLSTRPENLAAEAEYASFVDCLHIAPSQLEQRRVDQAPLGDVCLEDYAGVILGGGPFNNTDTDKSDLQRRVEADLAQLAAQLIEKDFPTFGACYGVGIIGTAIGADLDRAYAEEPAAVPISLTPEGLADPLCEGLPPEFHALVGHKENCSSLPQMATVLATGQQCPIQMFKTGDNVYVTQFHPELDHDSFAQRLDIYEDEGYFDPTEKRRINSQAARYAVDTSARLLHNFATRYMPWR